MPTVIRFAALRLSYAALLLAAPDLVIRLSTGHPANRITRAVVRLLGGRHLIQGILTGNRPSTPMLALGAAADLAHALSMLALAALNQRRRRAELTDAAVAATLAISGAILATRAQPSLMPTATIRPFASTGEFSSPISAYHRHRRSIDSFCHSLFSQTPSLLTSCFAGLGWFYRGTPPPYRTFGGLDVIV
jgi:hypothetical protein